MGAAAYNRGSLAISRQLCQEYGCPGCASCKTSAPTPRPADWGSKIHAKATKRAISLLHYWTVIREKPAPVQCDLADMIQMSIRCGRQTAESAAHEALEAIR